MAVMFSLTFSKRCTERSETSEKKTKKLLTDTLVYCSTATKIRISRTSSKASVQVYLERTQGFPVGKTRPDTGRAAAPTSAISVGPGTWTYVLAWFAGGGNAVARTRSLRHQPQGINTVAPNERASAVTVVT